jgi:hypothetical protein
VPNGERLFLVSADESLLADAVRVMPRPQARARAGAAQPFMSPSELTPGAANTFRFHDEIVINEILYHAPPTHRRPGTPPQTATHTILSWDARWRYDQSGANLGSDWRKPDYDDSAWASGPGVLGYRTGVLAEPIRTPLTLGRWTYYFRVPFVLANPAQATNLQLRVLVDDGGVFYLNGVEVYRQKMPEGEIAFTTPAVNVGDPPITGPHSLQVINLVAGTNWLAAEVHQWNLDSSDIVCGAELAVTER